MVLNRNGHRRSPTSALQTLADGAPACKIQSHRIRLTRAVSEFHTNIGKLFSTIETHLVSPARNRERSADVAVPAAKDPLKEILY